MQTINLIHKNLGSIDYKIDTFPDGEKHITIIPELDHKNSARIVCRIKNGDDLFILMQVADILNRHEIEFTIDIKYLMSARMDRIMSEFRPYSLKIVANVIKGLNAGCVNLVDIHNEYNKYICDMYNKQAFGLLNDACYCFPDKGAFERYKYFVKRGQCIICTKNRCQKTGMLSDFVVSNPEVFQGGSITVIDDLCDGGGTFVGLAPKLRELNPTELILQVTHAIQKTGIEKVAKVYDKVIITNSFHDWETEDLPDNVKVIDVLR